MQQRLDMTMPIHLSYKKLVFLKENAKEAKQISSMKLKSLPLDNPLTDSSSSLVSVISIAASEVFGSLAIKKKQGEKVSFA